MFACNPKYMPQSHSDTPIIGFKAKNSKIAIAGCWVSEVYLKSLKEFKSPKRAQDNGLLLIIPKRVNEKVSYMEAFHDDFDYYSILKNKNTYEIWEIINDNPPKLEFVIEVISPTRIKIGTIVLEKINPLIKSDFLRRGLKEQVMIQEDLLFKGKYITSDNRKVEFTKDGKIKGLDDFYFYQPINDYYDMGMQVDQLVLVKSRKNIEWKDLEYFGFTFNHDTLELYKLNCISFDTTSGYCGEVENGELKYKLWRIR